MVEEGAKASQNIVVIRESVDSGRHGADAQYMQYRIAGNFREHKFSRITNKHARKKISRFLFSRQGHDIRPHPLQFPAWKW